MSEPEKNAKFNSDAVVARAQGIDDDVHSGEWDNAMMGLEELFEYASRLMTDLEDLL